MPTFECVSCGFTCGSAKAWQRHVDRFDGSDAHRLVDPSVMPPLEELSLFSGGSKALGLRDVLKGVGRALLDEERGGRVLQHSLESWRRSVDDVAQIEGRVHLTLGHAQLPLVAAARQGDLHEVQRLVDEAAGEAALLDVPDEAGVTALGWAASHGHEAVVTALIEAGARVSAAQDHPDSQPPLYVALTKGRLDVATLLLEARADPLEREPLRGQCALHAAVAEPLAEAAQEAHMCLLTRLLQVSAGQCPALHTMRRAQCPTSTPPLPAMAARAVPAEL